MIHFIWNRTNVVGSWYLFQDNVFVAKTKPQLTLYIVGYIFDIILKYIITQRSLQNVLIFRLLLKITVERLRECVSSYFLSPHGAHKHILVYLGKWSVKFGIRFCGKTMSTHVIIHQNLWIVCLILQQLDKLVFNKKVHIKHTCIIHTQII